MPKQSRHGSRFSASSEVQERRRKRDREYKRKLRSTPEGKLKSDAVNKKFRENNRIHRAAATEEWRTKYPIRDFLTRIKFHAKERGIPFDLKEEDLLPLPDCCPILGVEFKYRANCKSKIGPRGIHTPSIDRVDNTRGYTRDNVVIVSWRVNNIKCDAELWELKAILDYYTRRYRRLTLNPDWEPIKP